MDYPCSTDIEGGMKDRSLPPSFVFLLWWVIFLTFKIFTTFFCLCSWLHLSIVHPPCGFDLCHQSHPKTLFYWVFDSGFTTPPQSVSLTPFTEGPSPLSCTVPRPHPFWNGAFFDVLLVRPACNCSPSFTGFFAISLTLLYIIRFRTSNPSLYNKL